ncbi:hypothetical protein H6S82_25645, partial [Planktothrix sp. FACHB-1355]
MSFVALLILLVFVSAIPLGLALWLKKRYKKTKFVLFALTGLLVLTQTSVWLYDVSGMQAYNHYLQIQTFLNQPFTGLRQVGLTRSKGIIALSYMSEGLVSYAMQNPARKPEIIALLKKAIAIALHPDISP